MKSTCLRLLTLPAIALAFSSCSQNWSEAQKSQLSTVSVSEPSVKAGAMKDASGIDSPNAATTVPMATGGGLIPALIGVAIDAGVTAHQRSQFEKQYGQQLGKVNASVPKTVDKKLRASAEKMLRGDEFFGPRLKNDSPNRFSAELTSYGLERFHRTNDETHLGAGVNVLVRLNDANGEKLLEQVIAARSTNSVAVGELAAQPKKVDALFDEAAANFALQLKTALDRKLNR
jgi:hypothetical protein